MADTIAGPTKNGWSLPEIIELIYPSIAANMAITKMDTYLFTAKRINSPLAIPSRVNGINPKAIAAIKGTINNIIPRKPLKPSMMLGKAANIQLKNRRSSGPTTM